MDNSFSSPIILHGDWWVRHALWNKIGLAHARIESGSSFADYGRMPLSFYCDTHCLGVRSICSKLHQFFLNFVKVSLLLRWRERCRRRKIQRIVHEKDKARFAAFGREVQKDIMLLLELLDPDEDARGISDESAQENDAYFFPARPMSVL